MGASEGIEVILIGAKRPSERVGVLLIDEVRASESSEADREGAGLCL